MLFRKSTNTYFWTIIVAIIFGFSALVFSFFDEGWHAPAQVFAQLCSAGLVAATLFFQHKTNREERQQYYADRNNEEFLRYVNEISASVSKLQLNSLDSDNVILSEPVFKELVGRYEKIVTILSAPEFNHFDSSVDGELELEEAELEILADNVGSEYNRAIEDGKKEIRRKWHERNTNILLCKFYGIDQSMWQTYNVQSLSSIEHQTMSLLLSHHREELFCLFSSYATLNYFLEMHPSFRHAKIDYSAFLLSKFSIEHLRFFFLWAEYCKSKRIAHPTLLYDLLQKVKNLFNNKI